MSDLPFYLYIPLFYHALTREFFSCTSWNIVSSIFGSEGGLSSVIVTDTDRNSRTFHFFSPRRKDIFHFVVSTMPPKFQLPSKKNPTSEAHGAPTEIIVGNIKVSALGVEFIGANPESPLTIRSVKFDELEKKAVLGEGVQGSVSKYQTKDRTQTYAVKKIPIPPRDSLAMKTVTNELRNIFADATEYTVKLYNAYYRNGSLYLLMEYMDWGNAEELFSKLFPIPSVSTTTQFALGERSVAYIASQILHALSLLHTKQRLVTDDEGSKERRQIHRDIKPANILLSVNGAVKLADFGVAANADSIGAQSFVGTATYMSPERIKGQKYGTPSDIWSCGVVVAQFLIGKYPFSAVNDGFMQLLKQVTSVESLDLKGQASPEASDFVNKCIRQREEDRSSADDLLKHPWIVANAEAGKCELIVLLEQLGDSTMHRQLTSASVTSGDETPGTPNDGRKVAPAAEKSGEPRSK
jgi:serine/threonine protein kinase